MSYRLGMMPAQDTEHSAMPAQEGSGNSTMPTQEGSWLSTMPTQKGSEKMALPTQKGSGNMALPTQKGSENMALVTQEGSENMALPTQEGSENMALPTQEGSENMALPTQKGSENMALPTQKISENMALPTQKGSGNMALPTQEGSENMALPTQEGSENMALPTQEGSELLPVISHYIDKATIHGMSAMGGQSLYHCRSCIWCVLLLAMTSGLVTLTYLHYQRYTAYPFVTLVSAHVRDSLPFPAVTICNVNQFHRQRVNHDDKRLEKLLYKMSEFHYLKQTGSVYSTPNAQTGDQLMRFAQTAAHKLEDMLILCMWKTKVVRCDQIFSRTLTNLGFCYTFNSHPDRKQLKATDSGYLGGLRVFLNIEQHAYHFPRFIYAGIKVLLHEPSEAPLLLHNGFSVGPGTFTSVAVRREEIRRLPPPFKAFGKSTCLDNNAQDFRSPLTRFQNYSYTKNACWQNCFVETMAGSCGCRHFFHLGDEPLCSLEDLESCYLPLSANVTLEDIKRCDCPTPCTEVVYHHSLSSANVASTFTMEQLLNASFITKKSDVRDSLIQLAVYYETLTSSEVYQQEEMTFMGILGNLGGHMGLCLGASLLSLMELLEVLLLLLCRCALTCFSKCTAPARCARPPKT